MATLNTLTKMKAYLNRCQRYYVIDVLLKVNRYILRGHESGANHFLVEKTTFQKWLGV